MPPKGLGLRWTSLGVKHTGGGPRTLWVARSTPLFRMLWRSHRAHLYGLGMGIDRLRNGVAFWEKPDHDVALSRSLLAIIVLDACRLRRTAQACRREHERARRERAAEIERRRTAAAEGLRRILTDRSWAIHHHYVEDAQRLSHAHRIEDGDLSRAEAIVAGTDRTVDAATSRLESEVPSEDERACADETVRETILAAVRAITVNDADWAALRNHIGWSKATTVTGHVLALSDTLSARHAAHALRLLRIHQTQIPEPMRARIPL